MREISSSNDTDPPPHDRSNSTSSMPNISTARHRLLPQTPARHLRRSSSPRFLPTPPPPLLSSATASATSDCSLSNLEQQRFIARRLPQTPIRKLSTGLITAINKASLRQQYSNTASNDGDGSTNASSATGNIADNEWPSPTIVERKFSELRKISHGDINPASALLEHLTCGTPLRSLQRLSFLNQQQQLQHRYQQRQGGQFNQSQHSLDHSSATSINLSQNSSVSPSVEQLFLNKVVALRS
ncbi:unnamed protein product [Litomosoides sigmodontis]|uniref:Uncharacterized protein n=1 Tax=Litomosoides sigmodontis TaxID=42156 RepID=A0A3P7M8E4_LITSI|nr:unnamed protein product [Litomosoides sigmodontis]